MKKQQKKDYTHFIEDHMISCEIDYRGGTLKIDVSSLFDTDEEEAIMGAHQNYLGGGIAGAIVGAETFDKEKLNKKDRKVFDELKKAIKKYFYNANNGGGDDYMVKNVNTYEKTQSLPVSAY